MHICFLKLSGEFRRDAKRARTIQNKRAIGVRVIEVLLWLYVYISIRANLIKGTDRLCNSIYFHEKTYLIYADKILNTAGIGPIREIFELPCCKSIQYEPKHEQLLHLKYHNNERQKLYEPQLQETNLLTYAPNEDLNQTAHPRSLIRVFAVCIMQLSCKNTSTGLWSDCANANANLYLRWAYMSECTFSTIAE